MSATEVEGTECINEAAYHMIIVLNATTIL